MSSKREGGGLNVYLESNRQNHEVWNKIHINRELVVYENAALESEA